MSELMNQREPAPPKTAPKADGRPTSVNPAVPGELPSNRMSTSLGAVVSAADLAKAGTSGPDALRRLVSRRKVVFVTGFGPDEETFAHLAEGFGPLSTHPLHEFLGQNRTVTVIEDTAERLPAGFPWHTDLSWVECPPRFGFLQALEVPASGGDTLWVDLAAIHQSLSPLLQELVSSLVAVHQIDSSLLQTVVNHHGEKTGHRFRIAYPPVEHPLVRAHPDDGKPSLFLSPMYLDRIQGMSDTESTMLLKHLNDLVSDPNFAVRWHWTEGDVAIWDESCTVHRALIDHAPQRRRMRRCTVAGRQPIVHATAPI